jgi:hypothetical protein
LGRRRGVGVHFLCIIPSSGSGGRGNVRQLIAVETIIPRSPSWACPCAVEPRILKPPGEGFGRPCANKSNPALRDSIPRSGTG